MSVLLLRRLGIYVRRGKNTVMGVLRGWQWVQSGPCCSEEGVMMLTPLWRAMGYWRWWPSNGEGWDGGGGPVVVWVGVVVAPLC